MNQFTEDYYERGKEKGLSCYENYRWLPELTVPMCQELVRNLGITQTELILDFGCAKGYVVKAFRELGYRAYGVDISEYAVNQADKWTRPYLYIAGEKFLKLDADWTLCKDVLEHISEEQLTATLEHFREHTKKLFIAVPLGNNGKYTIPEMELDVTHQIRRPLWWWTSEVEKAGFKIISSAFIMPGIKENWTRKFPMGNGFIVAQ